MKCARCITDETNHNVSLWTRGGQRMWIIKPECDITAEKECFGK